MPYVGYLSQEPKCTLKVSRVSTQSFTKSSDVFHSKKIGKGLCVGERFGKHRPKGKATKWLKVERELGSIQESEEEVERGNDKKTISTTYEWRILEIIETNENLIFTLKRSVANNIPIWI